MLLQHAMRRQALPPLAPVAAGRETTTLNAAWTREGSAEVVLAPRSLPQVPHPLCRRAEASSARSVSPRSEKQPRGAPAPLPAQLACSVRVSAQPSEPGVRRRTRPARSGRPAGGVVALLFAPSAAGPTLAGRALSSRIVALAAPLARPAAARTSAAKGRVPRRVGGAACTPTQRCTGRRGHPAGAVRAPRCRLGDTCRSEGGGEKEMATRTRANPRIGVSRTHCGNLRNGLHLLAGCARPEGFAARAASLPRGVRPRRPRRRPPLRRSPAVEGSLRDCWCAGPRGSRAYRSASPKPRPPAERALAQAPSRCWLLAPRAPRSWSPRCRWRCEAGRLAGTAGPPRLRTLHSPSRRRGCSTAALCEELAAAVER